jgi:AAA15 family ATPase/GTPase
MVFYLNGKEAIMIQILSYSIENFRSFCNNQILTLGELESRSVTAIFGPNSGGKSNTGRALAVLQSMIVNSASANFLLPYDPFLLKEEHDSKDTRFEIYFKYGKRVFSYSVSYNSVRITEEVLKEKSVQVDRYKVIFHRTADGIQNASANRFGFGKILAKKTRSETLLITKAREDNNEYANIIFELMNSIMILPGDNPNLQSLAVNLLRMNPGLKEKTMQLLRNSDFSIQDFIIEDVPVPDDLIASLPFNDESKLNIKSAGGTTIRTSHVVRDKERKVVGMTQFDLMGQESMGTRKFFEMAAPIIHMLDTGGTIYIDEFGAYLHPTLANAIIALFKSEENTKGASLILNSHNTSIMDQTCLVRDDIYLIEKNLSEESIITPLIQKAVRESESFEKRYKNGLYGGIPIIRERS